MGEEKLVQCFMHIHAYSCIRKASLFIRVTTLASYGENEMEEVEMIK